VAKAPRSGQRSEGPEPDTLQIAAAESGRDIAKLREYHAEIGAILSRLDGERGPVDKASDHVRRHLPLYALAAVFALIIILIPTVNDRTDRTSAASDITAGDTSADTSGPVDVAVGGPTDADSDSPTDVGTSVRPGAGVAPTVDTSKPVGAVRKTGKTIAGFECKDGVRQLPFSAYAAPCIAKFSGSNGGATFRGVTDKTIKIIIRATSDSNSANAKTVDQVNKQSGRATRDEALALLKKWTGWLSKIYDLYGRKIEFVQYNSKVSNGTDEAQGKNKEGACADATDMIKTVKGFMALGFGTDLQLSQPFADCAVEKGGIVMPLVAAYFPESWYTERWDPWAWNLAMECEQITQDVAEYIGKRLWNRPAKWAKDALYQKKNRVLGTYVPDNDGYQHCVKLNEAKLKKDYGATVARRFNYQLDVARFPDQAAQAVPQFQAAGVTTLINACDTISTTFLTQQAHAQNWGPEWLLIGVALQDRAGNARLFDQDRVDGHMFGMSQLGKTSSIYGKAGEAFKAWKTAFGNAPTPAGYADVYYLGLHIFNMLQAAGPILTPANIAKGMHALPAGGGARGAFGTWDFKGDHTAIDDSREVYWVCRHDSPASCTGPAADDGGKGEYIETYGGRRFGTDEWPKGEPPIYR
jgi:hypothetical protein